MSKLIANLLGKPESFITHALAELEKITGYHSEDVRFLAQNNHRLRQKFEQLGLDPDDTTKEELYHALLARFQNDSRALDRALGVSDQSVLDHRIDVAIELVKKTAGQ